MSAKKMPKAEVVKKPTLEDELNAIVKQYNNAVNKEKEYANLAQRCLGAAELLQKMIDNEKEDNKN